MLFQVLQVRKENWIGIPRQENPSNSPAPGEGVGRGARNMQNTLGIFVFAHLHYRQAGA